MGYLSGDDKPEVLSKSTIGDALSDAIFQMEMNLLADFQNLENQDGIHWSRLLHMGGRTRH